MLKQVGKYTISERIGRGTYSRVYRAVDGQGRPVAIKVSTTRTEPDHLNEFQKDLVGAASVLHPNLVAVHDLGFEDDFPYLVMELVEGRDLDKILKSNAPPPLAERIRVMQQVGDALKAAHERGVFHLDVRPSKIMLADDGAAKLLDLGLGRLSFDPARVTEHGYLVGAPFYMGPERLTAIDTADDRCDIWSFGVTFYEWLSGRHPFYDDDGDRMIGNIMDAAPAPLAGVPPSLNYLVLHAIEKDPAERYQNFSDLLTDLRPLMVDLQREESESLMAEALKQTDSGRWHEARRIARKLRDIEPGQAAPSDVFGYSDAEAEQDWPEPEPAAPFAPPQAAPVNRVAVGAGIASAVAATAIETPEPAPAASFETAPITTASATETAPVAAPSQPKPQRPERTAPKIPNIGARNGSTVITGNGAPAETHSKQSNGSYPVADAPAAARESPESIPKRETTRIRPASIVPEPSHYASAAPRLTPSPQSTVRVLHLPEKSGFPWVKILGFALPALLMIGGLFFFLRSNPKTSSNEDAKKIAHPHVITDPSDSSASETTTSGGGQPTDTPPLSATSAASKDPSVANATGTPTDASALDPTAPRIFDPKSLAQIKPVRRTVLTPSLAKLSAPQLGNAPTSAAADTSTLPIGVNPPPPPVAPVVTPPPTTAAVPAQASTEGTSQSTSTAAPAQTTKSDATIRAGGVVSQPVLVRSVPPIYPPTAVARKTQGMVRFQATIAKDGSVKNLQLISGDPLLNVAAKQAVLQWKYRPAMLNGQPVEVPQAIVVKFNLSQQQ